MSDPTDAPTLSVTSRAGDRRESLIALRDLLASTLETADPANVAALAKQYRDTLAAIAELPDGQEVDAVDELAARRSGTPKAEVPQRPARGRKRRAAGD